MPRARISFFSAAILLLVSAEVQLLAPPAAQAGVLTRGSTTKGLSISAPKSRDRNVRKTTAALRATNPPLEFKGESTPDTYARLERAQFKYQQKYFRWEKKKYQLEQRALRKEMREKADEERAEKKQRSVAARNSKPHSPGTSSGTMQARQDQAKSEAVASALDPRAWFSKKIAKQEDGGILSLGKKEDGTAPAKKIGFWGHLKRAVFGVS